MSGAPPPVPGFDPFAGPAPLRSCPSTESQRELWLASQLGADASCAFNESVTVELRGPLGTEALRDALGDLLDAHEALRGAYSADGSVFVVTERVLDLEELDWSGRPAAEQDSAWRSLLHREVATPFDLGRGPLIRFRLVRRGALHHQLVLTAHHSVCDGWSLGVVVADLGRAYATRLGGGSGALAGRPGFCDYARSEREQEGGADHAAAIGFWTRRFAGEVPVLDLPTDRPRGARRSPASAREDFVLDPQLVARLKAFAAGQRASFTAAFLAGVKVLLARLCAQDDLVVAVPAAGQGLAGAADLVGHCVRTLPMRTSLDLERGFRDALRRVQATVLDSYEHHRLTLASLLKRLALGRDPARLPLADVLFNVESIGGEALEFPGLEVEWRSNPRCFENFDLFLNVVERPGATWLELQYATALYDPETVRRWVGSLCRLLEQAMDDPERPLAALDPVLPEDRGRLEAWNRTARDFGAPDTLTGLLDRGLERGGERVALVAGGDSLAYRELHARANRLARALAGRGVGRGDLVALCLPRGADLVVALLAILRSGAAWLPIDPELPARRVAWMLEDSGARTAVTTRSLAGRLPPGVALLCLDEAAGEVAALPADALPDSAGPGDLAYVIYTSGSTGTPKGVEVTHSAVANLLSSMAEEPGLQREDRLLAVTTLSFDISVLEVLGPLCAGARVVLASAEDGADGARLAACLERHDISVLQATPATFGLLLAAGWSGRRDLRLLCGGEALPLDLARQLLPRCRELWNLYGPTETCIWSTRARVPDAPETISIGRPIANTRCHVLDERMAPVPPGVPGELWIGGAGVARGYRGRPELTRERFVPDPFAGAAEPGARLYRTGDRVRQRADGTLEHLGRNDFQVKIRGHRIEIGEIESAIAACGVFEQPVVAARRFGEGDVRLVAWGVPRGREIDAAGLRRELGAWLPAYMIPQHVVAVPALPRTPNGKIDRAALPMPEAEAAPAGERTRPGIERTLEEIWCQVLGREEIGRDRDFFEIGGHSLLAARAMLRAGQALDRPLPMSLLFEHPTIARLAAHLAASASAGGAERIPRRARRDSAPLSGMQERVWFAEQMHPGDGLHHLPVAWRLRGRLDLGAFQRALAEFARRQESTRTVFGWSGAEAVQRVRDDLAIGAALVDLSDLRAARRETRLAQLLRAETARPFDLERGPLFRAQLYRLGPEEHVFLAVAHHAIWDGHSADVLERELDALYGAFRRGEPSPLPPLAIDYGDFAAWHRQWLEGEALARQRRYWLERLAGELPRLALETARRRPARFDHAAASLRASLREAERARLHEVARRRDATLFMVLVAAFGCLVHAESGETDLIVGTPIHGRSWSGTEDLVGFFANAQALRTRLSPEAPFLEFLARVRETCLGAFANQDMPFDRLVRDLGGPRDASRTPVYQLFFTCEDRSARSGRLGDLACEEIDVPPAAAQTELGLWARDGRDRIDLGLDYATSLYSARRAEQLLGSYRRILERIAREPEAPVAELVRAPRKGLAARLRGRRRARGRAGSS